MPRKDRGDQPGSLHHVVNRGIARRTMFETPRDRRMFLALAARAVRAGRIRILSFAILTTHFHLLVRSEQGRLDEAMRFIQAGYSRYFNRGRKRDGPLVRGRYLSRLVDSDAYLDAVHAYIDLNPVQAGMVDSPREYEFCRAGLLARRHPPRWLAPSNWTPTLSGQEPSVDLDALAFLVEGRLDRSEVADGDELFDSTPSQVLTWMRRKSALGDGTSPGLPVCDPWTVLATVAAHREELLALPRRKRSAEKTRWRSMQCGLLRQLTGLRIGDIAKRTQISRSAAADSVHMHGRLLLEEQPYTELAARLALNALQLGPLARRSGRIHRSGEKW